MARSRLLSLSVFVALALGGCATTPTACVQPRTAAASSLANEGYGVAGEVISALTAGKISGQMAIKLNADLQQAQSDIRSGKTAEAQAIIAQVKSALP